MELSPEEKDEKIKEFRAGPTGASLQKVTVMKICQRFNKILLSINALIARVGLWINNISKTQRELFFNLSESNLVVYKSLLLRVLCLKP